ncbi:MAG: DEAD/DEAH box helicase [Bryobacterales bacterium]
MSRKRNTIEARKAVEDWFAAKGWTPFPFQKRCWKAYLAGDDGLLHAATGAGKTLAVGLGPAIEALAEGSRDSRARVLWVTPLRALAADTAQALKPPFATSACLGRWRLGPATRRRAFATAKRNVCRRYS